MFIDRRLQPWLALGGLLAEAAEAGARRVQRSLSRRRQSGFARRPGPDSPMWNCLAREIRSRTRRRGAQVQLARYLGVPRQRLHDFVSRRSRLPDAELTLRLLHWLAEMDAGRDRAL